jgi:hypothetical protein
MSVNVVWIRLTVQKTKAYASRIQLKVQGFEECGAIMREPQLSYND